jgi:predicted RNA-binding protein (TIGR00451 family)
MRRQFAKRDIKEFLERHPYAEGLLTVKSSVVEEDCRLLVDNRIAFRKADGLDEWIPSLEILRAKPGILPVVVVDKGAPPFILKGADLMRPGVLSCEAFAKDAIVVLVDETHRFPLATGRALFSSDDLMGQSGGKVVKILHNLKS